MCPTKDCISSVSKGHRGSVYRPGAREARLQLAQPAASSAGLAVKRALCFHCELRPPGYITACMPRANTGGLTILWDDLIPAMPGSESPCPLSSPAQPPGHPHQSREREGERVRMQGGARRGCLMGGASVAMSPQVSLHIVGAM